MNKNEFTEQQKKNRAEDKKALRKFLPLLILFFVVGVLCGICSTALGHMAEQGVWAGLEPYIRAVAIYGGLVLSTGLVIACIILLRKSRKEYAAWDEENEEVLNSIDIKISYVMWFSSLIMYGSYFFFAAGTWATKIAEGWASPEEIPGIAIAVVFFNIIYSMVAACMIQQRAINLEKEINPEKAGSVYDTKFTNKWLDTSDEAEKYTTYKCAYKAHMVTSITGGILWVVCIIGQMRFHTGVFATIVVTILLIVQVSASCLQAIYFAKHPSEVMK